jgi:ATP-dependent exoDNAse (exonuclease V) alpha subunit
MSANLTQTLTSQEVTAKLRNGTNVFLTGGAGVGKSHNLNLIKQNFNAPIVVAPTGIAAAHIKGETIHSFFRFPIDKEAGLRALNDTKKAELQEIFSKFDLLIIDEISMVGDYLLNWIGIRFTELGVDMPVLVVGDFYQLPPVDPDGDINFSFDSHFWREKSFETVELTEVFRTKNSEFSKVLNDLRVGNITTRAKEYVKQMKKNENSDEFTHLYSTNKKAFEHNKKMLSYIKAKPYFYNLVEKFFGDGESDEKLFEFKKKQLRAKFENRLYLKEGALVMFTHNRWDEGIYNGKKGYVTKLTDDKIFVDNIEVEKEMIEICKYKTVTKDGKKTIEKIVIGELHQFPIKPAYAITIHKSQGMSIEGLSVDLTNIFAPGQAYVALSRAIDPNKTAITLSNEPLEKVFYPDKRVKKFYS